MTDPLGFPGPVGGLKLHPAQHLAQHHPHLDHGEPGAQAAAVAAAERQPGRRAQRRAHHPVGVEPFRVGVEPGAGVHQPDSGGHHDPGRQVVAGDLDRFFE